MNESCNYNPYATEDNGTILATMIVWKLVVGETTISYSPDGSNHSDNTGLFLIRIAK